MKRVNGIPNSLEQGPMLFYGWIKIVNYNLKRFSESKSINLVLSLVTQDIKCKFAASKNNHD